MNTIGSRLRDFCNGVKISQAELAEITGIHQNTIGNIFRDKHDPSASKIAVIANVLKINLNWLILGIGPAITEDDLRTNFGMYPKDEIKKGNTNRGSHFGNAAPGSFQQHLEISGKVKKGIKQNIKTSVPVGRDRTFISNHSLSVLERYEMLPVEQRSIISEMIDFYLSKSHNKSSKK